MNLVQQDIVLTFSGEAGEVAEIALHLGLDSSDNEVFIMTENLSKSQIEWLANKVGVPYIGSTTSILFEVAEE